jgi:hypothetical protein
MAAHFSVSTKRGKMRAGDIRGKLAAYLLSPLLDHFLLQAPSHLPLSRFPATLTRSRKLTAEGIFCCELNHSVFSSQGVCMFNQASASDITHHVGRKMSKQNSRQKNFEGKMKDYDGALTSRLLPSD